MKLITLYLPAFSSSNTQVTTRGLRVFRSTDLKYSSLARLTTTGEASAAELARALGQSHQLVIQKCPALIRLGLITQHPDPADARRKLFRLTEKGQVQMAMQDRYSEEISDVYRRLFEETGDVHAMILKTLRALKARPLRERTAPKSR